MNRRRDITIATMLTVAASVALTTSAFAFERTKTCIENSASRFACEVDEIPLPIAWPSTCVGYYIHDEFGDTVLNGADSLAIVERSFEHWNEVECSALQMQLRGRTNETRPGFDGCPDERNANVISFVADEWTHQSNAVALTSVTYNTQTGIILDADIEMNGDLYTIGVMASTQPCLPATEREECGWADLENALTHEVGHFLGLDHTASETYVPAVGEDQTDYSRASMFAETRNGEYTKRTLTDDDRAGVCDIYPIPESGEVLACTQADDGYYRAPSRSPGDECERSGCRCGTAPSRSPGPLALFVSILAICTRRVRQAL